MVPGVDPEGWDDLEALRGLTEVEIHVAWGIHPQAVGRLDDAGITQSLDRLARRLAADRGGGLAVGECGLHFRDDVDPEQRRRQIVACGAHLNLAARFKRPAILHCVGAHGPMLETLERYVGPPAVLHGYSGSAEMARRYCALGHYVSFSGALTRPNARRVLDAARAVPDDRLLAETDSPDQTPSGRGSVRNEPAFIIDVVERLAALRDATVADIAALTETNARRVYGLEPRA